MKKRKWVAVVLAAVLAAAGVFCLAGCGEKEGVTFDTIKAAFEAEGYTYSAPEENVLGAVGVEKAGVFTKGTASGVLYEYKDAKMAELLKSDLTVVNGVFVLVQVAKNAEMAEIFNGCFA